MIDYIQIFHSRRVWRCFKLKLSLTHVYQDDCFSDDDDDDTLVNDAVPVVPAFQDVTDIEKSMSSLDEVDNVDMRGKTNYARLSISVTM